MPRCWFLLARMFLRIDGVLVRIRETRYYHAFGQPDVHVEVSWKECSIKAAGEAELPYPMPHCAIAPHVLRDSSTLSQQVPVAVQKFYSVKLL